MKKVLFLILFIPEILSAQSCDCQKDYQWLKNFFEENDAGFQLTVERKGMESYVLRCREFGNGTITQLVRKTYFRSIRCLKCS
jgi:hypothetical protein